MSAHRVPCQLPGERSRSCPALLHPLTTSWAAAVAHDGAAPLGYWHDVVSSCDDGPHSARLGEWSEDQLQTVLLDVAALGGWLVHHEVDSRKTKAGWPDLVLARRDRLMVLELKRARPRHGVSVDQARWLDALALTEAEVAVVGPGDVSAMTAALTRGYHLPPYRRPPRPAGV